MVIPEPAPVCKCPGPALRPFLASWVCPYHGKVENPLPPMPQVEKV